MEWSWSEAHLCFPGGDCEAVVGARQPRLWPDFFTGPLGTRSQGGVKHFGLGGGGVTSRIPHCRLQYIRLRLSGSPKCKRGLMSETGVGWMKRNCSKLGRKTVNDSQSPPPCLSTFFTRHGGVTGPWHSAPDKRGILEARFHKRWERSESSGLGLIHEQFGLGATPLHSAGPKYRPTFPFSPAEGQGPGSERLNTYPGGRRERSKP